MVLSSFICQEIDFLFHIQLQIFSHLLEAVNIGCIQVPVRSTIRACYQFKWVLAFS